MGTIVFSFLTSLAITFLMHVNLMMKFPEWADDRGSLLRKLSAESLIISPVIGTGLALIPGFNVKLSTICFAVMIAIVVYNFIQSCVTDFVYRLVSAPMMNLSIILMTVYALVFSFSNDFHNLSTIIISIVVGFALFTLPSVGGADVRAVILLSLLISPLYGIMASGYAILLAMILCLLAYAFSKYVKNIFFGHKGIPAVPFILFSALLIFAILTFQQHLLILNGIIN